VPSPDAQCGRPSIPPEKPRCALLLQAFSSVRSAHQLIEKLDYNLLFRWFVGLSLDAMVWDVRVFTKSRERLIAGDLPRGFMAAVLNQERVEALLSEEHFSVDGTLIEAWASMKSFRPKDGSGEPPAPGRNGERNFHGEKHSNHRHALVVNTRLTLVTGMTEREAALDMAATRPGSHRMTLAANKAYDVAGFRKTRHCGLARVGWMLLRPRSAAQAGGGSGIATPG
jgi:transposase